MIALSFRTLFLAALRDTRGAARTLIDARLPQNELWLALLLGAILSVIPVSLAFSVNQSPDDEVQQALRQALPFHAAPLLAAPLQWGQAAIWVFVIHWVGLAFGGKGERQDILAVLAFLQIFSCAIILIVTALGFLVPILGAFGILVFICWWFYAVITFVDEAHGFDSPFKTALILIGALVAALICSSVVFGIVGGLFFRHVEVTQVYDVSKIRADFPILSREVNGKPLVYLDNGASAQKPQVVIDAVTKAYAEEYANVHRGLHYLSNLATEKYEGVRGIIARFLNAPKADDIVLNSGTTEGINTVAYGWAMPRLAPGDEIVLSIMEHHANIVPWHFLRERQGIVLKWVDVDASGALDPQAVLDAIGPKTKLVAITHMSNVLGTVVDVKAICAGAQALGVPVLVDGSQAAVHMPVDMQDIGADFYAITGHKLYGPSGSGAIYIRPERMAEMRPFMGGGDMIKEVTRDEVVYNDPPMMFEAGTPGIVQTIGLGVALDYMMQVGMADIAGHEADLRDYAAARLGGLNWLQVQGNTPDKGAIFSFTLDGAAHAHDISTILDKKGVAVRAGQHCANPLMDHMGLPATCRASFGMYNTKAEVDVLVEALELAHELFA